MTRRTGFIGLVLAAWAAIGVSVLVHGCSDGDRAAQTLKALGHTDVRTGGYSWACGGTDQCTEFWSKGPSGDPVHGGVDCDLFTNGCRVVTKP